MGDIPIRWMIPEELRLTVEGVRHALLRVDVLLTSIHDANKAQFQWVHSPSEDIKCIGSCVHKVELRQDTNSASALRINGTGKFQRLRISEIDICRGDCQYDAGS